MSFVNKHNVLYDGQYGFRKQFSTTMALMELVEEITTATDNSGLTVGIFVDLKKAFDTINHAILIKKLEKYGIRGIASDWIISYLSNRSQFVCFCGENSDSMSVTCGIPQGSILGPSLFILYINDICNVSQKLKFILFADDTNVFYSGKDIKEICDVISGELEKLNLWFQVNKLSLNINKTQFMIFHCKNVNVDVTIKINNIQIERVYVAKFLGIFIDAKFTWVNHIKMVQSKISKSCAILYKLKYLLSQRTMYILYCTLILPYINYCCEVWGNTCKSRLVSLIRIQKKAIRNVGNIEYLGHTEPIFVKFSTLKLLDIIELKTVIILYKAYNNILPSNLSQYFKLVSDEHHHNTRQRGTFKVTYVRTKLKAMTISIHGKKYGII